MNVMPDEIDERDALTAAAHQMNLEEREQEEADRAVERMLYADRLARLQSELLSVAAELSVIADRLCRSALQ